MLVSGSIHLEPGNGKSLICPEKTIFAFGSFDYQVLISGARYSTSKCYHPALATLPIYLILKMLNSGVFQNVQPLRVITGLLFVNFMKVMTTLRKIVIIKNNKNIFHMCLTSSHFNYFNVWCLSAKLLRLEWGSKN